MASQQIGQILLSKFGQQDAAAIKSGVLGGLILDDAGNVSK